MNLDSDADLRWQPGTIGTTHTLNLKLGVTASEFLTGGNPVLELATRSAGIRAEIATAFINGHMPGIVASTGEATHVEGRLETVTETTWNARTGVERSGPRGVSVDANMDIAIHIKTSRPVTAIQALAASRSAVAGNVAECLVARLKQEFLGADETRSNSSNLFVDDKAANYRVRETGEGPLSN